MHRLLYISLLMLFCSGAAQAQKKFIYVDTALLQQEEVAAPEVDYTDYDSTISIETYAEPEPPDTALIANSLFIPFDSVKKWRREKSYAYTAYLDSLLRAKKLKDPPKPIRMPSGGVFNDLLSSGFISTTLWILAISFVVFIVYRLFVADGAFKRKTTQANNISTEAEPEEINADTNFDGLINNALQGGNYRLAVRYQYLRSLHTLAGKALLVLAPDKTNYQYVRELADRQYREAFAAITLHYDYVWYGGFEIDAESYQRIVKDFIHFNKKLS